MPQFVRYVTVGGFNTVFGYSIFALLNWLFKRLGSYSYMYAWVLANFIAISAAFLAYKWFVFRTSGNYLVEYLRCFGVYSTALLINAAALPILVSILRHVLHNRDLAPYVGVAILTILTVVISFVGHKKISFRRIPAND